MNLTWSRYDVWVDRGERAFVFNARSGALVELTRAQRAAVDAVVAGTGAIPAVEGLGEVLHGLVSTSVLVAPEADEVELLRRRYEASRHGERLALTIVTSLACNFDCPYCFEEKRPVSLRPEVADAIVRLVQQRMPCGGVDVTWFGGEPLLGTRQLLDLAARIDAVCTDHRVDQVGTIVTNGWFLDGPTAAALAAHGVRRAQVTVDGPKEVHDAYRPGKGGRSTYDRVVGNLAAASAHLDVDVRVNVDAGNAGRVEELLDDLAGRGLAGRVTVGAAAIRGDHGSPARRFTTAEFAEVELGVEALAAPLGFDRRGLPMPIGAPCTAVRHGEVVVGPAGELWRCWDEVGDDAASIGSIHDLVALESIDADDWLDRSPFADEQCRSCIALPVCMGGCPQLRRSVDRDAQCGTFRSHHQQRIAAFVDGLRGEEPSVVAARAAIAVTVSGAGRPVPAPMSTPVGLGPTRRRAATLAEAT